MDLKKKEVTTEKHKMKTSQKGIELIKKFEGCELESYPDPASGLFNECIKRKINPYSGGYKKISNWQKLKALPWTIGHGHTNRVKSGDIITKQDAEDFLHEDLLPKEKTVNNVVKIKLSQNQFDALVSFTFNEGEGALITSTMLKLLNSNRIKDAANEFDKWIYAGHKKNNGLINRRKAEKELFLS